ncbi:PH domain-containing protein [Aeromicrobium sp. CTD01-1L150]|uniref:PH domain-containing protein n=1 Tax=Aeromicrobium sp. CTD01-1L150 TaxID=3341830 RepID=UPI0035C191E3
MALSRKLLMTGESVIETTRTHVKVLFVPLVVFLAGSFAGGFLAAQAGNAGDGWVRWVVVAIAAVLVIWFAVIPFVRWLLWTYTLTNKRIVEQKGILTREGRVIPLSRVNDVSFEKNLNDRILRCGTLVVHTASEEQGLLLRDIPGIEDFHRTVSTLVYDSHQPRDDQI